MSYNDSISVMEDGMDTLFAGMYGIMFLAILAVGIACYVLRALSMHTIARRRGLNKPWLAWLPIGDAWILGSISDQYRYLVKGEHKSKRKILLGLSIGSTACVLLVFAAAISLIARLTMADAEGIISDSQRASIVMGPVLTMLGIALVMSAVSITGLVFRYMSLYDLYCSCDPSNATAFLAVGIVGSFAGNLIPSIGFLGTLLEPIFLMVVREKDLGMPPRKRPEYTPVFEEPVTGPEID